jgi:hypothetical protein
MVYGSYTATTLSAKASSARTELFDQGRKVLTQMAQQLSCSYVAKEEQNSPPNVSAFQDVKKIKNKVETIFEANPDKIDGQILHFVTTTNAIKNSSQPDGLFEVIYRFDKQTGRLWLSRQRFVTNTNDSVKNRTWLPVGKNITSLNITFYDGLTWVDNWSFKEKNILPPAVKISLNLEHQDCRKYEFSTIANVYCQNPKNGQYQTKLLSSNNR